MTNLIRLGELGLCRCVLGKGKLVKVRCWGNSALLSERAARACGLNRLLHCVTILCIQLSQTEKNLVAGAFRGSGWMRIAWMTRSWGGIIGDGSEGANASNDPYVDHQYRAAL